LDARIDDAHLIGRKRVAVDFADTNVRAAVHLQRSGDVLQEDGARAAIDIELVAAKIPGPVQAPSQDLLSKVNAARAKGK
jgi:hypothetical protein